MSQHRPDGGWCSSSHTAFLGSSCTPQGSSGLRWESLQTPFANTNACKTNLDNSRPGVCSARQGLLYIFKTWLWFCHHESLDWNSSHNPRGSLTWSGKDLIFKGLCQLSKGTVVHMKFLWNSGKYEK